MSKLKLYALAITAKRYNENRQVERVTIKAGVCLARNRDEAIGKGIASARKLWPSEEFWHSYAATVDEVSAWMIDVAYLHSQEVTND